MSPMRGLSGRGVGKDNVSEAREACFMIHPLAVKENDFWTFITIILNIVHRGQKFDIV